MTYKTKCKTKDFNGQIGDFHKNAQSSERQCLTSCITLPAQISNSMNIFSSVQFSQWEYLPSTVETTMNMAKYIGVKGVNGQSAHLCTVLQQN